VNAQMTMRIAHVAIWTADLEGLVAFYTRYFGAVAGPRYVNASRGFESHFLTFEGGARLELMRVPDVRARPPAGGGSEEQGEITI
jgi:lactoylglutathione lyase